MTITIENVFPARAGMNRALKLLRGNRARVPRSRGDEPVCVHRAVHAAGVFPARAGMNRVQTQKCWAAWCVPRSRGDEPLAVSEIYVG